MRPSHLHLSAASGARARAKLLLPLLVAQLWGEAGDRAWRKAPGPEAMGERALTTNPRALLLLLPLPLGPQHPPMSRKRAWP